MIRPGQARGGSSRPCGGAAGRYGPAPLWGAGRARAAGPRIDAAPRFRGFYSTVTDLARFLGLSMSLPRAKAVW
ncbi:hypothetical protein B7767_02490 [Streptomyces sp. 13-12-16]|nr:hypothetical protein B7767_02490 [Streptomyces sp. 13-12-16]